jgi:hypothetical protein
MLNKALPNALARLLQKSDINTVRYAKVFVSSVHNYVVNNLLHAGDYLTVVTYTCMSNSILY